MLLVLFNHVGLETFSGGFIGVDVFFVISGYLIGSHILEDIRAGRFSMARFYERRFRRIMPALLAMLLVTSCWAYAYLYPGELKNFADTEIGALFSFSNLVLLHQTGYFDPVGKARPLLHTWSLAVEEQFYIVFPLLLSAIMRWARRYLKFLLFLLTAGLFALAEYWTPRLTSQAFFLAPFRAWEFLCGALLAAKALPRLHGTWLRNGASILGVLLILGCGFMYRETTLFPGRNALAPCLGACLVIAAGDTGTSLVGRVLAWNPIRWIGLISYSLYLWHWPIQFFQATNRFLVPDRAPLWHSQFAVIGVSFVVAALSWRFVEQPFRTGLFRGKRVPLFAINGGLFALVLACAFLVTHQDLIPHWVPRFDMAQEAQVAVGTVEEMRLGSCFVAADQLASQFQRSTCLREEPGRRQYLVAGDSHSAHGFWGLKTTFPEINFSQFSVISCRPLIPSSGPSNDPCAPARRYLYDDYLSHHRVDTVILFARWEATDLDLIQATVDWLEQRGIKVIVIGPSIEFDAPLPRLLGLARREHDPLLPNRHLMLEPAALDREMKRRARDQWHVAYLSIYDTLCDPPGVDDRATLHGCALYGAPGIPLLLDKDHFSPAGSILFAQKIRDRHELP